MKKLSTKLNTKTIFKIIFVGLLMIVIIKNLWPVTVL